MTDELVVRKVKNVIKATPLYTRSKQIYWKVMGSNLKKEAMAPQTRQVLKEKFQDDVALLAEYTGLPVKKFWKDYVFSSKYPALIRHIIFPRIVLRRLDLIQ